MDENTGKIARINDLLDNLNQVTDGLRAMLGSEGLRSYTTRQLQYIKLIGGGDGTTVTQIAAVLGIRKPTASFVVNQLIEQNVIRKVQSETDRRFFTLVLTEKGQAVYSTYQEINSQVLERMQFFFKPEEIEALCDQMTRLKKITDYLQLQYAAQ